MNERAEVAETEAVEVEEAAPVEIVVAEVVIEAVEDLIATNNHYPYWFRLSF